MKVTLLMLFASAALASAQTYTHQRIGNFDYWNGPNGYQGTGQQIGGFYHYNDNRGNSWTGQQIGNFQYWNHANQYGQYGQ